MVELCRRLETAYGLPERRLGFEIQIETSQAILGADGEAAVAAMVHAADHRCTGLHFGTYDYTAALGISGGFQSMDHPAADHAKAVMQLAAAGTGVRVSDGSTNIVPVGDRDACSGRVGNCTRDSSPARWGVASIRVGISIRLSCRPVSSRRTCSSAATSTR